MYPQSKVVLYRFVKIPLFTVAQGMLNNFFFVSLRLSPPKQRVRKINKTCSHKKKTVASCYLIFDKTFVLGSLHLQHVTKATDVTYSQLWGSIKTGIYLKIHQEILNYKSLKQKRQTYVQQYKKTRAQ